MSIQDLKPIDQLRALLSAGGDDDALHELLDELQPYDISLLLEELDHNDQLSLLKVLPPEIAAETLEHFEPIEQYSFLDNLSDDSMVSILNQMSSDGVVQLFTALHPRQVEQMSGCLEPSFQEQIHRLMTYPENTAGSLVNLDYIAARRWWTAEQTLAHLRKVGEKAEIYNYIYVLGPRGELVGVLSLRDLILANPSTPVHEIMGTKPITVPAEEDQEEVARMLAQYDLVALPVIGAGGNMVGVITVDDVIDIIEEEATEDIHLLGGSQPLDTPYLQAGIYGVFRKRIVWLLMLFVAGAITSNILQYYEGALAQVVALSFFIPLLIGAGGNAGAQTCTMVIRAMVVGDVGLKDFLVVIWREMRLGVVLGLAMAAVGFGWALFLEGDFTLGLLISSTLTTVIIVSSTIGAAMPIIGKRLGLDPAVFSAPMITTVVDAVGLLIYFQFARMLVL